MRTIIIQKRRQAVFIGVLCVALIGIASPASAAIHIYTIEVDAALSRMEVVARFAAPANAISARSRDAGRFLLDARDCDNGDQISNRGRRLTISGNGIRCLSYAVDL
ncbi:MAG: hypothetical protein OEU90_04025, partial [Gammaproteobacteria bacterium]|nr:hypothetical protein [Gammaproteobacteria bacterium]